MLDKKTVIQEAVDHYKKLGENGSLIANMVAAHLEALLEDEKSQILEAWQAGFDFGDYPSAPYQEEYYNYKYKTKLNAERSTSGKDITNN
jgi:hypothetical protein